MADRDDFLDIERLKQELQGVKIDLSGVLDDSRREINYGVREVVGSEGFTYNKTSNMIYADTMATTEVVGPTSYHQLTSFTHQVQVQPPLQPSGFISSSIAKQFQPQGSPQHVALTNPVNAPNVYHQRQQGGQQEGKYIQAATHQHENRAPIKSVEEYYNTASKLQHMDEASLSRMLLPKEVAELFLTKQNVGSAVHQLASSCKDKVTNF